MENLLAPFSLQGSTAAWALGPDTKLQMIAVDDIGWFGARAFTDAATLNRREIDLAGDVRTMPEAAQILTAALGWPIAFAQTPVEHVRQYSTETASMLKWFGRVVTLALGIMIWKTWPASAEWVIGTLVGNSMIFSGMTRLMLSLAARTMVTKLA